jgi:hypothetical protein
MAVVGAAAGALLGVGVGGGGAVAGAISGATPGLGAAGVGGSVSALGNLTKDVAGRNYTEGAARFAVNFVGGKIVSRIAEGGGIGAFLDLGTRRFLADVYGNAAQAIIGRKFSSDSPVNCEDIE